MDELLFVSLCAVICGCEGWLDVEEFGKTKLEFLRGYLPFSQGVPSDDTFRRFFRAIDPDKFQECFINWVKSIKLPISEKVIAIDGKGIA